MGNRTSSDVSMRAIKASATALTNAVAPAKRSGFENYLKDHADRLSNDYELITQHCTRDERILEIGASPYFLTKALADAGYGVTTVDLPGPDTARLGETVAVEAVYRNIETEQLPFTDASFDEVLLNEVFEHLRIDLIFTLGEIRRVLKPGGRLWLSTPNLRSLRGIYNFLVKSEAWSSMGEGLYFMYAHLATRGAGHVREYTSVEVSRFLQAVGFSIERVLYRGRYKSRTGRILCRIAPQFRPYYSIIARR